MLRNLKEGFVNQGVCWFSRDVASYGACFFERFEVYMMFVSNERSSFVKQIIRLNNVLFVCLLGINP